MFSKNLHNTVTINDFWKYFCFTLQIYNCIKIPYCVVKNGSDI